MPDQQHTIAHAFVTEMAQKGYAVAGSIDSYNCIIDVSEFADIDEAAEMLSDDEANLPQLTSSETKYYAIIAGNKNGIDVYEYFYGKLDCSCHTPLEDTHSMFQDITSQVFESYHNAELLNVGPIPSDRVAFSGIEEPFMIEVNYTDSWLEFNYKFNKSKGTTTLHLYCTAVEMYNLLIDLYEAYSAGAM